MLGDHRAISDDASDDAVNDAPRFAARSAFIPYLDASLMNKHAAGDGGRSYTAACCAFAEIRFCPPDFGWCTCNYSWNIANLHEQLKTHGHTTSRLVNRGADHGIRCDRERVNCLNIYY